ncbi:MAG TPA: NAD(P)H-dependent oxidoreductase [Isosphaeraceae bacterium]|nr:NAD(P)H-dependent oxidoreductase [Isosphaeraceae bacterium]
MGEKPRVLAWAGSTRKESFNKKLVRIAARAAEQAGAEVTLIDLADFRMPLFDQDLEAASGQPESAKQLKRLMVEHEGFLISAPEYNSSVTGVLKNAIDWVSRPVPGEPKLVAFQGKTAALMSASPGALGGLRGLVHLRAILGNIGVLVLPGQVAVSKAHEAFDGEGRLNDGKQQSGIEALGTELAGILEKLRG